MNSSPTPPFRTIAGMGKKNPAVDSYIEEAQPFARPIIRKLRALFHKADARLDEKIKWGCPSFEYKGMVGGFAAFKKHVSWGMLKASLMKGKSAAMKSDASSPFGGGSVTNVSQLPPDETLIDLIRQGVALNEAGVKNPKRTNLKKKPPAKTPPDLAAALGRNALAKKTFEAFSPSHKREYIEWITEAKQDVTRQKRLATAIVWMAEGKPRNWKYLKC